MRFCEGPLGLRLDAAVDELAGRRIEADLAGAEDEAAGEDALAVRPDGRRGAVRPDRVAIMRPSLVLASVVAMMDGPRPPCSAATVAAPARGSRARRRGPPPGRASAAVAASASEG